MCRNIKTLHNLSSLQFVRELSGFTRPSKANEADFDRAVDKVSRAAACVVWRRRLRSRHTIRAVCRPSSQPSSEAVALARALTGANATSTVSYGTEAGLFEQAGYPTVICGPGDIAQAHAADEFVTLAQLDACMTFLPTLAERLAV